MKHRLLTAMLVLVPVVLAGCSFPQAGAEPRSSPTPSTRPSKPSPSRPTASSSPVPVTGTAKAIIAELGRVRVLAIRPEAPGYRRDQFGQAWSDDHAGLGGHNGCDTRNDVLGAQLQARKYRGRSQCVVIAGTLVAEPYTGKRLEFRKEAAAEIQIDHIYPLSRAWDMGAAKWPKQRRVDFANDAASNLIAVSGPANASKSDSGPGEWLPINRAYRCTYVLRYLQVARKWSLPITAADRDSARTITHICR
ncbi:HNH endonuclease family protein [Kribbella sp. CA-293567]|uniref:HNH endonuclease family protein n=1 Tax=Kribbella sp. CA-293567 TaxID=3002436 RepID=UPI0022DE4CBD|nr:HNH endonuclease family protein [Kribbella sp. CA-293567]WBQ08343.1 HNH endonuclease family protein [Kribbella sp. CA-293567]